MKLKKKKIWQNHEQNNRLSKIMEYKYQSLVE